MALSAGLLSNPTFARLFAAQVASLLGSGVTSVALAALAYSLAGGRATVIVGTALGLRILAFVTLAPIAGIVADRVDRKRLLVAADLVRVALLALFPFVETVWQVYALIFAVNAATAFFTPAFEASLPEVAGQAHYTRALALSRVAVDLEGVGGPLLAAVLIATVGVRLTFWFDGLTYLISALLLVGVRLPKTDAAAETFRWREMIPQVTLSTRVLLREPALRQALLLHAAEALGGAAAIVCTVVYVREVLGRGDTAFAAAMAALGAGSSLAAVIIARRRPAVPADASARRDEHLRYHHWAGRVLVAGGGVLSIALLPGILRPGLGLLLALWVLNGAGQAMVAIPSVGLLAEHTVPAERGRAYAAHFAWTHLFWLGTYPAVGYLSQAVGVPATFTVVGIGAGVVTVLAGLAGRGAHREHVI